MKEKELTITEKQRKGLEILQVIGKPICCKELITKHKKLVKEQGFDTERPNGINATLASVVMKELATKEPKQYGDKIFTHYSINEKGLAFLNKKENN